MSLKFETALADRETSKADQEYHLVADLEIAGETYAAVRPPFKAYTMFLKESHGIRNNPAAAAGVAFQFLNAAFDEQDLRAALIETGDYEPSDNDQYRDPDLSDAGVDLARSNTRISRRFFDREDELGEATLVDVMIGLLEHWAGKDATGSRPTSKPPSKRAGKRSTGSTSAAGSTSSKSQTARTRGSSRSRSRG